MGEAKDRAEEEEKKKEEEEEEEEEEEDEDEEISQQAKKKRTDRHDQDSSQGGGTPALSVRHLGIPGMNGTSPSSDLISHISVTPSERTERGTIHVDISSAASSDREDEEATDETMAQKKEREI